MARRDPTPTFAIPIEGTAARLAPPAPLPRLMAALSDTARLRCVALRITRDAEAANDVVQNAVEKALRHRAEFRGDARPSTWLHRIVVNEALAWRRSEGRRARHTVAAHDTRETVAAPPPQPLDELISRERRAGLLRGLTALRPDERDLLARFALDGSYAGWARAKRIKATAAKTRAFRARQQLRALLGESEA
jgi:RNA polymerase sigma-70 factor, ECF subfamily